MKRVIGVAAVLAAVGCGSASETKNTGVPQDDGTVGSPTFPAGIYVASYDGSDLNDGSPLAPMRSINKAIEHAKATAQTDVWIYGGGFNNGSPEVVVLRAGVNLHGSICFSGAAPVEADMAACRTSIVGGSPSLVAIDIHENTLVENLEVVGLPGVQAGGANEGFFEVAGIGCIGRGINSRLPSCQRPVDSEGRMAPFSSVAVALSHSDKVFFRNVTAIAGDGASGLDGAEGDLGQSSIRPANGLPAGNAPYKAGAGAASVAPASCLEAIGGKGGQGGRFRWKLDYAWSESACANGAFCPSTSTIYYETNLGHPGNQGEDSYLHAGGPTSAPEFMGYEAGAQGRNGLSAPLAAPGDAGIFGIREVDLVTLSAGEGARGDAGYTGRGGAGGSGGNPATRSVYKKESTSSTAAGSLTILGVGGSSSESSTTQTTLTGVGELAGGGGGAGGAGGCGGNGGVGGQGGASSVGIYLVDSVLGIENGSVATGRGGSGGRGGAGGEGGVGANGSEGGAGGQVSSINVVGTLTQSLSGGLFSLSATGQTMAGWTEGRTAARSGKGGSGGTGANGGKGGVGGAGAGGSSIAVVAKGESTITGSVAYELGAWGEAGDETGEAGQTLELLSL